MSVGVREGERVREGNETKSKSYKRCVSTKRHCFVPFLQFRIPNLKKPNAADVLVIIFFLLFLLNNPALFRCLIFMAK